jgi:hypothetical protein
VVVLRRCPGGVGCRTGVGHIQAILQGLREWQSFAASQLIECFTGNVLHDEVHSQFLGDPLDGDNDHESAVRYFALAPDAQLRGHRNRSKI